MSTGRGGLLIFFFNDTATTEIYTLSLHDALPICVHQPLERQVDDEASGLAGLDNRPRAADRLACPGRAHRHRMGVAGDRKSTRLNSSHANISYAVFCLKKKKNQDTYRTLLSRPPP